MDFGSLNRSIESVPIEYEDKSSLKRVFPLKIDIINSRIYGQMKGNGICFRKAVNFQNTLFFNELDLSDAIFQDKIDLSYTISRKKIDFSNAIFQDEIDLSKTISMKEIGFSNAIFNDFTCREASFSSALFEDAIFNSSNQINFEKSTFVDLRFQSVYFESQANFDSCKFNGSTDFSYTIFSSAPIFTEASFLGDILFNYAEFKEDVDFSHLSFDRSIDCSDANFSNLADFSNTRFNNFALFRNADFRGDAFFDNARFNNDAFFDNASFDKDISLNQTYYQRLYARWSCLEKGLKYNDEAFLSLIENYKNLGWFEDADNCYYKYRIEYARHAYDISLPPISELLNNPEDYITHWYYLLNNIILKLVDFLFMVINGYGVRPFRPLILIIFIIPAFGFIYWYKDNVSFSSAIKFSAVVFLAGSGKLFVQAPDYKPKSSFKKVMFYLELIIGMVIFIALLVAFSKTVLR